MVQDSDKNVRANATYLEWILEAVHKIKHQKQRPSQERIANAIRLNHQVSHDSIAEQLELAVKDGSIIRVDNNGFTYKDPAQVSQGKGRAFEITKKPELAKVVIKCLEDNSGSKGLMLKTIEKYIQSNYNLSGRQGGNVTGQLRLCIRKLIQKKTVVQVGKFVKLNVQADDEVEKDTSSSVLGNMSLEEANLEVILPFERRRVSETNLFSMQL